MPAGNLAVPFGALMAGAVIIDYGTRNLRNAFSSNSAGTVGAGGNASGSVTQTAGMPPSVNPVPGAQTSRADQGIDATGTKFVSPWDGTVEIADAHNSGWAGGGYIAIRSHFNPNQVFYLAEGIIPTVHVGDIVTAGQSIAMPVSNPYNGVTGNVEFGLANPAAPGQPLAQVIGDARGMVLNLVKWFEALGGSPPTSLSSAGSA